MLCSGWWVWFLHENGESNNILISGMNEESEMSKEASEMVIQKTSNLLETQELKLLLGAVWGRNIQSREKWVLYL
jgi:hypothetical protein